MINSRKLNKKGVSLPLNTVVIAIILLIVLAVVMFQFTGGMSRFGKDTKCKTECVSSMNDCGKDLPQGSTTKYIPVPMSCDVAGTTEETKTLATYCCIEQTQ